MQITVKTIKHHVYKIHHRQVGDVYELPENELGIWQALGCVVPFTAPAAPQMRSARIAKPATPAKDQPK